MQYSYSDFVNAYESGLIKVLVADKAALQIAESSLLPKGCKNVYLCLSWLCLLIIPFGIYFTIFRTWWIGLLIIFVVRPYLCKVVLARVKLWVLEFSLKDAEFYAAALSREALIVKPAD